MVYSNGNYVVKYMTIPASNVKADTEVVLFETAPYILVAVKVKL